MQLNGFHSILIIQNGILFDIRIGGSMLFESGRCKIEMSGFKLAYDLSKFPVFGQEGFAHSYLSLSNIIGCFDDFKIASATFGIGHIELFSKEIHINFF